MWVLVISMLWQFMPIIYLSSIIYYLLIYHLTIYHLSNIYLASTIYVSSSIIYHPSVSHLSSVYFCICLSIYQLPIIYPPFIYRANIDLFPVVSLNSGWGVGKQLSVHFFLFVTIRIPTKEYQIANFAFGWAGTKLRSWE